MKKTILIAALAVATAMTAGAKTADQLRIYINPGHGSWTANDRPCSLVNHPNAYSRTNTDTLSFFETNTNLQKGFGVLERLISYGLTFDRSLNQTGDRHMIGAARDLSNNIVMSRVKNGPYHDDNGTAGQLGDAAPADLDYYNTNLSEICAEVCRNNFDMFISIHSNAATDGDGVNYPLYLYRGYDTPKEYENGSLANQNASQAMAKACWPYGIANSHSQWSNYKTGQNIRGDINFYGGTASTTVDGVTYTGYLGALRHNTPGFLVEGYFHTYQPARHRAMNFDVCALEGHAYARGIADYFSLQKEGTGTVYGIVRNQHEKFTDQWYHPVAGTKDAYKPLNGVTVTLKDASGNIVATKVTDDNFNGAFVFDGVNPGTYTIETSHPEYKAQAEPCTVTVTAATDVYPDIDLEANDYVPPQIVYVNYPDSAALSKDFAADDYTFSAVYTDEPIAELAGKTVRRAIMHEGKIYVLAIDGDGEDTATTKPSPTIIVYDPESKTVLANVSTTGTHGSIMDVSDIQVTADGVLLACNKTKNQYADSYIETGDEGRGTLYIYKWDNDANGLPTGDPAQWLSTKNSGRWYRTYAGSTFAYTGTSQEGTAVVMQPSTGPSRGLRSTSFGIVEGAQSSAADHLNPYAGPKMAETTCGGTHYRLITSPLDEGKWYLVSPTQGVSQWDFNVGDSGNPEATSSTELAGLNPDGHVGIFKYIGKSYMAVPAQTADGNNTGVTLVDITGNINNAKIVSTANTALAALATASVAALGEGCLAINATSGAVTGAYMNLYVLRDGKLTKLTTKEVAQPVYRREMAYDLSLDGPAGDEYTVNYKMTGDVSSATLVLTDIDSKEQIEIAMGPAQQGDNTYTLDASTLTQDHQYSWAVKVLNRQMAKAAEYSVDPSGLTVRGGVIPITDPQKPSFGYVSVAHGKANGIDVYDPAGTKVASRVFQGHAMFGGSKTTNQSNPFRGDELRGKAVFATWGDDAYGAVTFNPVDLTEEPATLFAGTKQSSGAFIYNGNTLGGGTASITFMGPDDNVTMYSFDEDNDQQSNAIMAMNLGNAWQITTSPYKIGWKSLLANTNVDLIAYKDGLFCSQNRAAGSNTAGCPAFCYLSSAPDFNNKTMTSATGDPQGFFDKSSTTTIAISRDGKTFAAGKSDAIGIFDVAWTDGTDAAGLPMSTPELTLRSTIPATDTWGTARFDYAGNLHYYGRESGYHVYAVPADDANVTTPALEASLVRGVPSAVENIAVDADNDAPVVYYNLNGVRMPANAQLTPGIYIRQQGAKAQKVVVK